MKTSEIHFCYKKQSGHPHEQENIYENTSHKTSAFQIVKNHRVRHFLSIMWRETLKFKMLYLKDGGCYGAKNLQRDIY